VAVDLTPLGTLAAPIGGDNGESEGVYPLARQPDQLLKVYKPQCATAADANRLDWLISLADKASAVDRAMVRTNSCWPLERVTDDARPAYGVLLPRAPDKFDTTMLIGNRTRPIQLVLDFLVYSPEKCLRHNIPMPTFEQRLRICTDIVAVADFLERNDAVYGDWSYANAFWCGTDHSGYVIDIDGCGYRERTFVATQNWQEPVASPTGMADNLTDRYGVALLLARCLTGVRDITPALDRLRQLAVMHRTTDLYTVVHNGMTAHRREERPSVGTLLDTLRRSSSGAGGGMIVTLPASGVAGWREPLAVAPPRVHMRQPPPPLPLPYISTKRRSAVASWLLFLLVVAVLVLVVTLIG
jgi:hypothetical protein